MYAWLFAAADAEHCSTRQQQPTVYQLQHPYFFVALKQLHTTVIEQLPYIYRLKRYIRNGIWNECINAAQVHVLQCSWQLLLFSPYDQKAGAHSNADAQTDGACRSTCCHQCNRSRCCESCTCCERYSAGCDRLHGYSKADWLCHRTPHDWREAQGKHAYNVLRISGHMLHSYSCINAVYTGRALRTKEQMVYSNPIWFLGAFLTHRDKQFLLAYTV